MNIFEDNLNTAVFTTNYVVNELKTITYVSHDADDGAWQFHSNDKIENIEEVARIVSLQEIIDIDKSILDLANLPTGYHAVRDNRSDTWKIYKTED